MDKEDFRSASGAIGVFVLVVLFSGVIFAIYPGWAVIGLFFEDNLQFSANTPAWIQAIGSVAAIFFACIFATKQMAHTEEHQRRIRSEETIQGILTCQLAASDAHGALQDLAKKLANAKDRPPSSSLERIEGLEETFRILLASRPHPVAVNQVLIVLTELAFSRVAIREYSSTLNRAYQTETSQKRAKKVEEAVSCLRELYHRESSRARGHTVH